MTKVVIGSGSHILFVLLLASPSVHAADPGFVERSPAGVKPIAAEREVLVTLAPKV